MMEGITVLSQNYISNTVGDIVLLILATLLFILALFVILYSLKIMREQDKSTGFLFLLFLLPIAVLFTVCLIGYVKNNPYTEYKVTISNEVKLKEFNEKYEIIDQDGEIYTIVEKDNG